MQMGFKEMVGETVSSGITPIYLSYDRMNYFAINKYILRSFLVIDSLDVGNLTYKQYRFVARRTRQGNALVRRHIEKLFRAYPELGADNESLECITVPVYARLLKGGELAELLMEAFASFPEVVPSKICIELSADILYEDVTEAKERLRDLREIGVKLAICEVGDEFCPVFRLSEFKFDYAFTDNYANETLGTESDDRVAGSLVKFLHLIDVKVFAPNLLTNEAAESARHLEFDGCGMDAEPALYSEGGDTYER